MSPAQRRDPDRLFPVDREVRAIARDLYERVADAQIISPHGHVPAALLDANLPFTDAADLLVIKGPLRHPAAACLGCRPVILRSRSRLG